MGRNYLDEIDHLNGKSESQRRFAPMVIAEMKSLIVFVENVDRFRENPHRAALGDMVRESWGDTTKVSRHDTNLMPELPNPLKGTLRSGPFSVARQAVPFPPVPPTRCRRRPENGDGGEQLSAAGLRCWNIPVRREHFVEIEGIHVEM